MKALPTKADGVFLPSGENRLQQMARNRERHLGNVIWGHPQASLGDTHHFDPASVGRVVPTSIRGHPLGEEIGEEIGNRGHPPNDLNSGTLTRLSLTRLSQCALTALKGRHVIAQGNALGSLP